MAARPRPQPLPFSSFGWSFAGALLIAFSLPPLGAFPLAWVGLVPLIARWSVRRPSVDYGRELYALLLTTSCCVGFWLLFNPDPGTAALGGLSLFLVPVPLTAAFLLAGLVRERAGVHAGLAALVLNVLATEFLTLAANVSVPWLLLGHTQVEAVDFIQMADVGGVLLLSLWVLALNVTVFLALPRTGRIGERYGERGATIALFTALLALPLAYGSIRTAQADVPAGYTRVGIVQPGIAPGEWDDQDAKTKVDYLAGLSDDLLGRWRGPAADSSGARAETAGRARGAGGLGLIVWPQSSLPFMGTDRGERQLYDRLERWCAQRDVALLAGATTASAGTDRRAGRPDAADLANSAVMIRPGKPVLRYDQMRRVPFADAQAAEGSSRTLLTVGGTDIATTVGFESMFGDHVRRFTQQGAGLIVVLSRNDLWGRSAGLFQHLQFTRLRAIESRRAVLLSTVSGVSAMILPGGAIEEIAGWMDQDVTGIDVPTFRGETFYVRHGDWVGRWALALALALNLGVVLASVFMPEVLPARSAFASSAVPARG